MTTLLLDLGLSLRKLRTSPGFTAVAVGTLALAIGANAVVFSVMNGFLFHPLRLPQEESLYAVWRANVTSSDSVRTLQMIPATRGSPVEPRR